MRTALFTIIIYPIQLILEFVYAFADHVFLDPGISIIAVSFAVCLLCLPLYMIAEEMQENERDTQKRLKSGILRIKSAFKGDEQYMILSAFYRQHQYHPVMALRSSVSLIIQIPFFIAAYVFLSELSALKGASFLFIKDLSEPDEIIRFGKYTLNLLPVLMTVINCIAGAVYTRGFPAREKIQLYAMAFIFLILLYGSPSGLVLYWTMNNVFSLIKNVFYKLKNPRRIISILVFISCIALAYYLFFIRKPAAVRVSGCVLAVSVLPALIFRLKRMVQRKTVPSAGSVVGCGGFFAAEIILLTVSAGILIPSSVIAASPAEFINPDAYRNPLYLIGKSLYISLGMIIFWPGIIYCMTPVKQRRTLTFAVLLCTFCGIINYLFFGTGLGSLSPQLVFGRGMSFSRTEKILNSVVLFSAAGVLFLLYKKKQRVIQFLLILFILPAGLLSVINIHSVNTKLNCMQYVKDKSSDRIEPVIRLSTKGKNVIVFMVDRAISSYLPYIFDEKPYLKKEFAGFTYYPNTVSFGMHTNFGAPPLFGGYEYTPEEMNRRSGKKLVEKHNEALKLLPALFSKAGYDVGVADLPYGNYQWVSDLSIFDGYPRVRKYHTIGRYADIWKRQHGITPGCSFKTDERNLFLYSMVKMSPVILQPLVYNSGNYWNPEKETLSSSFINSYSVLDYLPELTDVRDTPDNNLFMIDNDTAHEECFLQLPEYVPSPVIDNSAYRDHRFYNDKFYHVNMAAVMELGKWFSYMREKNVYDNTRIIIAADHGYSNGTFKKLLFNGIDAEGYNPLLMMKDFNSRDFVISNEFMTNADVPSLALLNIIPDPINPFTNEKINTAAKRAHPQLVTTSSRYDVEKNNGNVFDTGNGCWFTVHDDIFRKENWKKIN